MINFGENFFSAIATITKKKKKRKRFSPHLGCRAADMVHPGDTILAILDEIMGGILAILEMPERCHRCGDQILVDRSSCEGKSTRKSETDRSTGSSGCQRFRASRTQKKNRKKMLGMSSWPMAFHYTVKEITAVSSKPE